MLYAFGLRWVSANRLLIDYDEPVYVESALEYTQFIREGRLSWLAWNTSNMEHPALFKIVYGISFLPLPPVDQLYEKDFHPGQSIQDSQARSWGITGRYLSAALCAVTAGVLGYINPLAGFFLASNTISVKYTSQIYLESLPMLAGLLSLIFYQAYLRSLQQVRPKRRNSNLALAASAVFLGITAASKYLYCVVGLAILLNQLILVLRSKIGRRELLAIAAWGMISLLSFFVFNPMLWPHPVERLLSSITFHLHYPQTPNVQSYHYPIFQPIRWLSNPLAFYDPSPKTAFMVKIDNLIFGLAVLGLFRLFRRQPLHFVWLVVGLVTLLFWGTKWPQYVLIIMVPFCISASEGLSTITDLAKHAWRRSKAAA